MNSAEKESEQVMSEQEGTITCQLLSKTLEAATRVVQKTLLVPSTSLPSFSLSDKNPSL